MAEYLVEELGWEGCEGGCGAGGGREGFWQQLLVGGAGREMKGFE